MFRFEMSKRASRHAPGPASAWATDQTKLNGLLHRLSGAFVPFRDSRAGFEPRIRIFVPRRGPPTSGAALDGGRHVSFYEET